MREFKFKITDPLGIHARPAGLFVKEASSCPCNVFLTRGGKQVDAKKIFALMGLAVKCGDEVTVTTDGDGEEAAAASLEQFMQNNL